MKLYDYYRSTAAYRVRIALHHKGAAFQQRPVNLAQGQQQDAAYRSLNPQALVPAVVDDDGQVLVQSLAILEYLEETRPEPPLLPQSPLARARVRSLAQIVTSDIHPLQNLRVRQHLQQAHGWNLAAADAWCRHWIAEGLAALEARLAREGDTGRYCHGDQPSMADVCLVPQLYNARRYGLLLDSYPTVRRIDEACAKLPAFQAAHPDQQPDRPPSN